MQSTKLFRKTLATKLGAAAAATALVATFAAPMIASAQDPIVDPSTIKYGLEAEEGEGPQFTAVGLGQTSDLKGSIADIVNIVLGFLGIVAVIIILAGGFKWMTAGGNEDKVAEARQMVIQGLIGLVVIFAAWAIASFVITNLLTATS